jgi:hypothetical protein
MTLPLFLPSNAARNSGLDDNVRPGLPIYLLKCNDISRTLDNRHAHPAPEIREAVFVRYQKQLDREVEQGFVLAHCLNVVLLLLGLKRRSIVIAHKYPTCSVDIRVASYPLCGLL